MDFIERLFGIAPDGGSGTLEFILFAIPIIGVNYLMLRRKSKRERVLDADSPVPTEKLIWHARAISTALNTGWR